jgi:hypothetical protein
MMTLFRWLAREIGLTRYRAKWDVGPIYGFARRCQQIHRRKENSAPRACDCPTHGWNF